MSSVATPTYTRLPMLLRVLDALERQRDAPDFEVIVINDGSSDDTDRVLAQRKGIVYRAQPNGGPGRARNHGVSLARGRFVVFIGDDTGPQGTVVAGDARLPPGGRPPPPRPRDTRRPPGRRRPPLLDHIH